MFGLDDENWTFDKQVEELYQFFNGEEITIDKWTISSTINESAKKVVIDATFD